MVKQKSTQDKDWKTQVSSCCNKKVICGDICSKCLQYTEAKSGWLI